MGLTFSQLTSLSFHVNRASNSWVTTFPKFDLENQGSRSWVRSKLKVTTWVQHSVDSHPFPSMWIRHPIPELRLFQNLTLKIKGQGHGWGHSSKSQCGPNILSIHIPFVPCQSALPVLRYSIFKIWPWKSRVKVKWPWWCTTTGLDNSIELRMVQIHAGVSETRVLQSLAQVLPDFTSFWPIGKPILGKWANNYDSTQLQVQTSAWEHRYTDSELIIKITQKFATKYFDYFVSCFLVICKDVKYIIRHP